MVNRVPTRLTNYLSVALVCAALHCSLLGQRPIHKTATAPVFSIAGTIRWDKSYGTIPIGPTLKQAAANPCGQFYVAAVEPSSGKAIAYTSGALTLDSSPYYRGNVYICRYSFKVPGNTPLYVIAGMGGVLLLPKVSDEPYLVSDPWIGGTYNTPPKGAFRTFNGSRSVKLTTTNPTANIDFEMVYGRKDNPH